MDGGSVAKLLKYLELKRNLNFLDELEKDEDLLKIPDTKKIIGQLRCFLKYCTIFGVPFEVCACIRMCVCVFVCVHAYVMCARVYVLVCVHLFFICTVYLIDNCII